MNKKRLGLILPLALAVFFGFNSCRSTDNEFDTPNVSFVRDTLNVEKTAGYSDIDVQSTRVWTASTTADWITISPASGNSGSTSVRISYLANDAANAVDRTAEIIFAVGRTYSKKLIVTQSGQITRTGLFVLTFGTSAPSATPYPLFADYTDWGASGEGFLADSTTYTGSGSVRQPTTRLSSGYPNASAGSHAYLSNTQNIVISKIDTKGANLFDISFGVSAYDGISLNTFTIGQIDLFVSNNGTDWTPVSYSYEATPSGVATWGICSATCGIPEGSQRLYVKVAANANSGWQMRVDDITVLSRGSGVVNQPAVSTGQASTVTDSSAIINGSFTAPEGVNVTEVGIQYKQSGGTYIDVPAALPTAVFSVNVTGLTAGTSYYYRAYAKVGTTLYFGAVESFNTESQAIYAENMGATPVSATTTIAAHTGWQKGGSGGANATYEGTADVRTTSASPTANGFSGGNSVFFSTLPRTFTVKNINISNNTNFILSFGLGHFAANVVTTDMTVEGSLDGGSTWGPITYTVTTGTDWQSATGEFSVPANSTTLALRFTANIASVMRMDDIELNAGGSGALLNPTAPPADTLKTIAYIRSLKSNLEGKGTPTTTAGQEYTMGAYRIKGRVVSKYDGTQSLYGNLNNRSIAIQDSNLANSGMCIRVGSATNNTFAVGDQVDVVLTGGKMSYYAGQLQVALANDANITKTTASNSPKAATTITYTDLVSGNYECMYVALENVQATIDFADGLKSMYNTTHAGNVIMENQAGDHFLMYSSSKVPFGATIIPTGSGTLKGLGGVYVGTSTNYQVQPQVESDFSGLTGTRFGAAGTLTYGTPFFKGNIKVGTAISNASVAIPYTYGAGQVINASVAVSGAGAAGIDAVSSQQYTLGTGADTLYIPITGTPTTEGTVTFTIDGITLTTNTASTTVGPAGTGNEVALYSTGFESSEGFTAGTVYNNTSELASGNAGSQWGTIYGTPSTTGFISGAQSMQMRWYTSASSTMGYTYTKFIKNKVTKVTFKALNTGGLNVVVKYTTDGGASWIGAQTFTLTTTSADYSYTINASGLDNVQVKFEVTYTTTPTGTSRVTLDEVKIYGFE